MEKLLLYETSGYTYLISEFINFSMALYIFHLSVAVRSSS